jgi:hypothetical protein
LQAHIAAVFFIAAFRTYNFGSFFAFMLVAAPIFAAPKTIVEDGLSVSLKARDVSTLFFWNSLLCSGSSQFSTDFYQRL